MRQQLISAPLDEKRTFEHMAMSIVFCCDRIEPRSDILGNIPTQFGIHKYVVQVSHFLLADIQDAQRRFFGLVIFVVVQSVHRHSTRTISTRQLERHA